MLNTSDNESQPERAHRPWPMTVLCVLGFSFCVFMFFFVIVTFSFVNGFTRNGQIMIFIFSLIFISHFCIFISYWMMRKWGLYVYVLGLIGIFVGGSMSPQWQFSIRDSWIPLIIIGIGLFYYKRLR